MQDKNEATESEVNFKEKIIELNKEFELLSIPERLAQLYKNFDQNKIMITSSFAASSAYFLHLISTIAPTQEIFFIDTGYHFPETLEYKKQLTKLYNLNVTDIRAPEWKHEFTKKDKTYTYDPNFCCSINKIEPLQEISQSYEVWISGLMAWQSEHRSTLNIFEEKEELIKFYPLIDVSKQQRDAYIREHNLPFHPLLEKGFGSIGCTHCTVPGEEREGRWSNSTKTECGLHL